MHDILLVMHGMMDHPYTYREILRVGQGRIGVTAQLGVNRDWRSSDVFVELVSSETVLSNALYHYVFLLL